MVEESKSREELDERVGSIKTDEKRSEATKLIRGFRDRVDVSGSWAAERECLILLFTLAKYYAKQTEPVLSSGLMKGGVR